MRKKLSQYYNISTIAKDPSKMMILTKRRKVYEIKGEISLEKVNAIKREIDKKLIISYFIVQISSAVDENTSSHNIII